MVSVDFHRIEEMQHRDDWDAATTAMVAAAQAVERGGADCLVICTNTMHRMADEVQDAIGIPLIHIADATAAVVKAEGIDAVALLGTRFTMEQDFYRGRLAQKHGLDVRIPSPEGRTVVHDVIYDELVKGVVRDASRDRYLEIIEDLVDDGAAGVIAGCTEIELLVQASDVPVPYFPTTRIHAEAAVDWALGM
jgi:aspartate racemase